MVFRILPKDIAADVFSCLELEFQQYVITSLSDKDAAHIINNMMSDDHRHGRELVLLEHSGNLFLVHQCVQGHHALMHHLPDHGIRIAEEPIL